MTSVQGQAKQEPGAPDTGTETPVRPRRGPEEARRSSVTEKHVTTARPPNRSRNHPTRLQRTKISKIKFLENIKYRKIGKRPKYME